MAQIAIEKIYDVRVLGGQDAYKQFDMINAKLIEIKKNKIDLNNLFANTKDADELKKIITLMNELIAKERQLNKEKQKAALSMEELQKLEESREAKRKERDEKKAAAAKARLQQLDAEKKAEKDLAAIEEQRRKNDLNNERVRTEQAKGDKERARLLALQNAAAARAAKGGTGTAPIAGTYNDIAAQYKKALADVKSTATLGGPAMDKAINDLMRLKTQLDNFNRSLTQDKALIGEYTTGIMNAFSKLGLGKLIEGQVTTAKQSLNTLNTEFEKLRQELIKVQQTGQGSTAALERGLIENRNAAMQLESHLHTVQTEMRSMGQVGSSISTSIAQGFASIKGQLMQLMIGYLGFQQVINGVQESIQKNYMLSDQYADIQNRMHSTAGAVDTLVDSLRNLDTRSGVASLVDIGALISKKGVAANEIAGVTKAIDDLMVALGHEIGDPHEAVSSLIKLVNVYSEDKHVSAKNIEQIGGAIARLTTSGVATGRFLIDFSERMAGVRGITGITIDKVLGLGAALEELGQRTETSSTALSQLVVRLFTDADRYAKIIGVGVADYNKMLRDDVMSTFVLVAEKIKGNAGEMEQFFSGVTDMHLRGARAVGVLGDIAANADYARKRMATATAAMNENGIAAEMAATKQHTFAGEIDRLKKKFELFTTSHTFLAFLKMAVSLIGGLLAIVPLLTIIVATNTITWALNSVSLNRINLLTALNTGLTSKNIVVQWASNVILKTLTITQLAYNFVLGKFTGDALRAKTAMTLLNATLRANPIGAIVTVVAMLVTGLYYFVHWMNSSTDAVSRQTDALLLNSKISTDAKEAISGQTNKIQTLTTVLRDNTASLDSRQEALRELIALNPEYLKTLTLENVNTAEGTKLINDYVAALQRKAEYEATQRLMEEKNKKSLELQSVQFSLETKLAQFTHNGKMPDLNEQEKEYRNFYAATLPDKGAKNALANIKEQLAIANEELTAVSGLAAKKYKDATMGRTEDMVKADIERVKHSITKGVKDADLTGEFNKVLGLDNMQKKLGPANNLGLNKEFLDNQRSILRALEAELERFAKAKEEKTKTKRSKSEILNDIRNMDKNMSTMDESSVDYIASESKRKELLAEWKNGGFGKGKEELLKERDELMRVRRYNGATKQTMEDEIRLANDMPLYTKGRKDKASRLTGAEIDGSRMIDAERDNKIVELKTAYAEQDATQKTYNGRMIDNERTYLEELQKLEEDAIQKKHDYISGNSAIEIRMRAKYNLDLLESQQAYNDKFYKMDLDALNAAREAKSTAAKEKYDGVEDSSTANDVEKSVASLDYYNSMKSDYLQYMADMDALEKKNNKVSEKNQQDRRKALEQLTHQINKSLLKINKEAVENEFAELKAQNDANMRAIMAAKIAETTKILANPNTSYKQKKKAVDKLGVTVERENLRASDEDIDKQMQENEFLGKLDREADYNLRHDALQEQRYQNEQRRLDLNLTKEEKATKIKKQLLTEGVNAFAKASEEYLRIQQSKIDKDDQEAHKSLDWNKKKLDAQVQSNAQREASEKAYVMAQEQLQKNKVAKEKELAKQRMDIEFAVAVMKAAAAHVGDFGVGFAIEVAAITAGYAISRAALDKYEKGGDVPSGGGTFGGNSHANGGTPFGFKGRMFEAEANEIAIINKKSARSNDVISVTGTPKQIASGINAYGGGKNFAPGAAMRKYAYGGMLGAQVQPPSLLTSYHASKLAASGAGSNKATQQLYDMVTANANAIAGMGEHVRNITVTLNPNDVSKHQAGAAKSAKVSVI